MFRLRKDFALTHQLLVFIFMCVCGAHVCAPMCSSARVYMCFGLVVQEHPRMSSLLPEAT